MRIVVQRSGPARVQVDGVSVGSIDHGLVLLVGIRQGDTVEDVRYLAEKVAYLRIFDDGTGKMNSDVMQTGGSVLSISQFTLYGDVRKGRRPNYMEAARPEEAEQLYETFNGFLRQMGLHVETGRFGAMMSVELVNDGPVTIILDSQRMM